jgi:hypothetical protein
MNPNFNLISRPLTTEQQVSETLAAMEKTMERARKDPAYGRQLLLATGMYTRSGKIKKQFR